MRHARRALGKVVTSQGLVDFVQEGKFTNVPDHKPEKSNGAAPLPVEVAALTPKSPAAVPEKTAPTPDPLVSPNDGAAATSGAAAAEIKADDETEGLEEADKEFPERVRKRINAKHRAMKEAQEAASDAERFAETQFNERKLLEQRLARIEAEKQELQAKIEPKKPEIELKEPEIAAYTNAEGQVDWIKFQRDTAEFASKKAIDEFVQTQAAERAAVEKAEAELRMHKRFEAVRKAHPDFDKTVESIKGTEADQVPQHILNYLFESDQGGELHYYLMKHPEESTRIAKMKPYLAIGELGRLEDRLTKPPEAPKPAPAVAPPIVVVQRGGAPAPITPLSGEGSVGINTDPAKMSYKELRAYERARAREKH